QWASRRLTAQGHPAACDKLSVFRGAILPATDDVRDRAWSTSGPLRILFVGADAFRKGLVPLYNAVKRLRETGGEVELTVVSSVSGITYVFDDLVPPAEVWRQKLDQTPWVRHH